MQISSRKTARLGRDALITKSTATISLSPGSNVLITNCVFGDDLVYSEAEKGTVSINIARERVQAVAAAYARTISCFDNVPSRLRVGWRKATQSLKDPRYGRPLS
jgi:hypothetical protein